MFWLKWAFCISAQLLNPAKLSILNRFFLKLLEIIMNFGGNSGSFIFCFTDILNMAIVIEIITSYISTSSSPARAPTFKSDKLVCIEMLIQFKLSWGYYKAEEGDENIVTLIPVIFRFNVLDILLHYHFSSSSFFQVFQRYFELCKKDLYF